MESAKWKNDYNTAEDLTHLLMKFFELVKSPEVLEEFEKSKKDPLDLSEKELEALTKALHIPKMIKK